MKVIAVIAISHENNADVAVKFQFMTLCAGLEASQIRIAPKQVHSIYPKTKPNQTSKYNRGIGA